MTDGTQRYRRPEKVIEELNEIVKLHPGKRLRIHIADPNFAGKRRITEELYERMAEWRKGIDADVRFFCSLRPSAISESRELTQKMFDAGIDYLFVGMESPNNVELKRVLKGGETRERQEVAAKYLRELGAEIMSNFLIGLPDQTPEDVLGLVEYAKGLGLADCYFSVVTPLPGSVLYNEAVEKGILLETDYTKYRLYDTVMKHPIMTRQQIREMCVRANAKWYDDLMLPAERRRSMANGHKRKLYDFAGKFTVLVNFFSMLGSGANQEFAELEPDVMVKDMPNPALREFTEKHPVHTFIDMERFLRVLGPQRIQVTMQSKGRDIVSWVAETTSEGVKFIDAIHGAPTEPATVRVNVAMDPGSLTPLKFVRNILADNASLESRIGLARIVAAAGSEVAAAYRDRTVERVKTGAADLVRDGRKRLRGLADRLLGREEPVAKPAPVSTVKAATLAVPPPKVRTPSTLPANVLLKKLKPEKVVEPVAAPAPEMAAAK
jgi:hypothetical protein